MKLISIKSEAQRAMLERVVADPAEALKRGMTAELARASLAASVARKLPTRLRASRSRG